MSSLWALLLFRLLFVLFLRLRFFLLVDWILLETDSFLFVLNDFCYDLHNFIVVGPLIGVELWKDKDVVDVYLKWAYPRENDLLIVDFIDEQILLIFDFLRFYEFIRYWVLDDDGVIDKLLYFSFD